MSDDNLSNIYSFNTEISSDGKIDFPDDDLKNLARKGYREVKVDIFGNSEKAAENEGIDLTVFRKIKSMQLLPESIVHGFLISKGSLNKDDFNEIETDNNL